MILAILFFLVVIGVIAFSRIQTNESSNKEKGGNVNSGVNTSKGIESQLSSNNPIAEVNSVRSLEKTVNQRKGYLVHVTEYKNLASILNNGILSMKELRNRGIIPALLTNSLSQGLDIRNGTDNYVHLAFDEGYSMFSAKIRNNSIKNPVILKIDPSVLTRNRCEFSNCNASSNQFRFESHDKILPTLDFEKIYYPKERIRTFYQFNEFKQFKQAEVLVETAIPASYIKEIIILKDMPMPAAAAPANVKITFGNPIDILKYDLGYGYSKIN